MEGQIHKQETQDAEELDWAERFEHLANQLARISPSMSIQGRVKTTMGLYASIFLTPSSWAEMDYEAKAPDSSVFSIRTVAAGYAIRISRLRL